MNAADWQAAIFVPESVSTVVLGFALAWMARVFGVVWSMVWAVGNGRIGENVGD